VRQDFPWSLNLYFHTGGGIPHPSCKAKLLGEPIDERTKSDPLHHSSRHETPASKDWEAVSIVVRM
jgi:hypothetical protein